MGVHYSKFPSLEVAAEVGNIAYGVGSVNDVEQVHSVLCKLNTGDSCQPEVDNVFAAKNHANASMVLEVGIQPVGTRLEGWLFS